MGTSLLLTLAAESGTLQAGAAKIDIAPSVEAALPMSGCADREEGFKGSITTSMPVPLYLATEADWQR